MTGMKRHPDAAASQSADTERESESGEGAARSSGRSEGDGSESRADRLDRIRRDIAAGRYDRQDLLETALEIMQRRLQESAES